MTTLPNRAALADLCNERGIRRAVEVGTDRGLFAEQFLDRFAGEILVCVDAWAPYPEMPFDRTPDLLMAATRLTRFGDRVKLARASSTEAAPVIGRRYQPGFVYVDADHRYESVLTDLRAWWPWVIPGGVLAGHDYMPDHAGVIRAVDEFAGTCGLPVQVTDNLDEYRSWWVEKAA